MLRWMASNVAVELDAVRNLNYSKQKSTERIDGIGTGIMTLGRAMLRPDPDDDGPLIWEDDG